LLVVEEKRKIEPEPLGTRKEEGKKEEGGSKNSTKSKTPMGEKNIKDNLLPGDIRRCLGRARWRTRKKTMGPEEGGQQYETRMQRTRGDKLYHGKNLAQQ